MCSETLPCYILDYPPKHSLLIDHFWLLKTWRKSPYFLKVETSVRFLSLKELLKMCCFLFRNLINEIVKHTLAVSKHQGISFILQEYEVYEVSSN